MKELWPLERVKQLDFASPTGFMKVGDFLPYVKEEVRQDIAGQYAILKKSMKENGQIVTFHVSKDLRRLRDGIHRIAIAEELGWEFVYISTERQATDWDNTEDGQRYWQLWNWRLNGFRQRQEI